MVGVALLELLERKSLEPNWLQTALDKIRVRQNTDPLKQNRYANAIINR